jgi:hypothetical protein
MYFLVYLDTRERRRADWRLRGAVGLRDWSAEASTMALGGSHL